WPLDEVIAEPRRGEHPRRNGSTLLHDHDWLPAALDHRKMVSIREKKAKRAKTVTIQIECERFGAPHVLAMQQMRNDGAAAERRRYSVSASRIAVEDHRDQAGVVDSNPSPVGGWIDGQDRRPGTELPDLRRPCQRSRHRLVPVAADAQA